MLGHGGPIVRRVAHRDPAPGRRLCVHVRPIANPEEGDVPHPGAGRKDVVVHSRIVKDHGVGLAEAGDQLFPGGGDVRVDHHLPDRPEGSHLIGIEDAGRTVGEDDPQGVSFGEQMVGHSARGA